MQRGAKDLKKLQNMSLFRAKKYFKAACLDPGVHGPCIAPSRLQG